jgi:two-component system response regulator YesN
LEQFTQMLSSAEPEEIDKRVMTLLNQIGTYASGNIAVAKILISELCITIAKYYFKQHNNEWVLGKTLDEILADVNRLGNTDQAADYIKGVLKQLREREQEGKATAYSAIVRNILNYIQENYNQELGLNVVAEHFRLSQGHISRLLRKETGSSFVDIVTHTRLEAAKRLMRDPTRRIQEISEMVGFKNYIYFYQVFKKVENLSPQEYKNTL